MSTYIDSWVCGVNCFHARVAPFDEAAERNREMNEQLEKDRQAETKVIKLLLLGGPESGKSTIFKQMKILHMNGFSEVELKNYRYLVYNNLIQATFQIIDGARSLNIDFEENILKEVETFLDYYNNTPFSEYQVTFALASTIGRIYRAPFAKKVLSRCHEVSLLDSAIYFFDNIIRIALPQYIPNHQDILQARAQTNGIVEINFPFKKHILKMIDVGGQRTERRKWIHCFDNVNSILFVTDISGYSKFDENSTPNKINRMKVSIVLYRQILNTDSLKKAVMILFLNKVDIFKDLIKQFPLNICFRSYSGANTFEDGSNFIKDYFKAVNEISEMQKPQEGIDKRDLYIHFSTATDTNMIEKIFDCCIESVISHAMQTSGMA